LVEFLIDSGSPINTVTEKNWSEIIENKAQVTNVSSECSRVFKGYASQSPLEVLTTFKAVAIVNKKKPTVEARFFVIKNATRALLSRTTSMQLGLLNFSMEVQAVREAIKPFPKFPGPAVRLEVDKSVVPTQLAYYRVPVAVEELVEQKLQTMLDQDIIEVVNGPATWISPLLVVPKGIDDVRLCVDMRGPNKSIKRNHHPMPVIETFLPKLKGMKKHSRIDMSNAYYHMELSEESRALTAFMTGRGVMRYKRMMFGLNAAPEIFQKRITTMLQGLEGVIAFVDDIVVSGRNDEEHDARLKLLLQRLEENNATLNEKKCLYGQSEIEILGFLVDGKGIRPAESKVRAIKDFREPETKEEVRSFLGLVQFVGHFIPNLATKTEPLRKMIRQEVTQFGEEQRTAFNALRLELSTTVMKLGYFDQKDATEVYVDASPVGLGAVLIQKKKGIARVIAFASKSLTDTERNYPQTQREALAAVWAVERFYFYLFGLKFKLFTDHKTLEYIFKNLHQNNKRACTRAEGWALRLQPYNYEMIHLPGQSNIADIL
jgi:RNase H-like domain found in reverse transcriptase/Reverse transcriptase (RNA-dependent DNA polymerase)